MLKLIALTLVGCFLLLGQGHGSPPPSTNIQTEIQSIKQMVSDLLRRMRIYDTRTANFRKQMLELANINRQTILSSFQATQEAKFQSYLNNLNNFAGSPNLGFGNFFTNKIHENQLKLHGTLIAQLQIKLAKIMAAMKCNTACTNQIECDKNADRTPTVLGYTCTCKAGYIGNGKICKDINECTCADEAHTHICDPNAECTNTIGSFTCKCKPGYHGNGKQCSMTNECTVNDNCTTNAECTNNGGRFTCTCKSGYSGDGRQCTNINECSPANPDIENECDTNADCANTEGGYTCKCRAGFHGNGKQCTDINECTDNMYKHGCDTNADCTNTEGGYTCKCRAGFHGNGNQCADINECTDNMYKHDCDTNADCTNTEGGFTCKCRAGFHGNGNQCADINECNPTNPDIESECDTNADCTNTEGGYTCKCRAGFHGNGKQCTDINECTDNMYKHDCETNAYCSNTDGSFTCNCRTGYIENGEHCIDINECTDSVYKHDCDKFADCSNTNGSYTCKCKTGFHGDGKQCTGTGECSAAVRAFQSPIDITTRGGKFGSFGVDPSTSSSPRNVFYMNGNDNVKSLKVYPTMDDYVNFSNDQTYNLLKGCDSAQSRVIGNKLYCPGFSAANILVYDLDDVSKYHTIDLPGAASGNRCPYTSGGYSDIDIEYDGAVYILWSKASENCKFIISRIDKDDNIERTWYTNINKGASGQAFIICGKMYVVDSHKGTTSIDVIYDLSTKETTTGNGFVFTTGHGHTASISYDPIDKVLYGWDNGHQVKIHVTFEKKQSDACSRDVQAFKFPEDVSERGKKFGSYGVDSSTQKVFYMNGKDNVKSLIVYTNMADYVTNSNRQKYTLPKGCDGAQSRVIDNKLHCQEYNAANVLVYDLDDVSKYHTIELPGAASGNQCSYTSGGYSDIDIKYDGTAAYILWSKASENCKFIISRIGKDDNIERTWYTNISKSASGQAFMICEKMYVVDSHKGDASVNVIYDLRTGKTSTGNGFVFNAVHGHIASLNYNPMENMLYGWDNGHQIKLLVTFEDKQSGQCSGGVQTFKPPKDVSKRGKKYGSFGEDPSTGKVFYMNGHDNVKSLTVYSNMADYASDSNGHTYTLLKGCDGAQSRVINNKLYCPEYNAGNVLVYDLDDVSKYHTITLPGAAYGNQCPYLSGGYSDIDIEYDGTNVFIFWSKSSENCKLIISRIDKDDRAERTWSTGVRKTIGHAFIICGKMYVVDSHSGETTISVIYDLKANKTASGDGLVFSTGHGHTASLYYNPSKHTLYAWDNGYQVTIPVVFGRQCSSDVISFKQPVDKTKRGSTKGSFGKDPSTGMVYFLDNVSPALSLLIYSDMEDYVSNSNARTYQLTKGCLGAQSQVINDKLYCQDTSAPGIMIYDLPNVNQYRTIALPGAAHKSECSYPNVIYSDMDIAHDGGDVYILWAKRSENCKIIISKISKDDKVEQTWVTGISKFGIGQAFIICGKMYVVNQATSIAFIYDLSTNLTTVPNGLAFDSGHGLVSSAHYSQEGEMLYIWDNGYQVEMGVNFS